MGKNSWRRQKEAVTVKQNASTSPNSATRINFRLLSVTSSSPESGFHIRIMAAPDPNARPTEGKIYPEDEVHKAHNLIEKCMQLYMDRDETAHALETHFQIDRHLTHIVWDRLEECNQEFFQNYYTRLALIQQITRFNQLLEQQHRAMNFPPVPAEEQMPMEVSETAPQNDSPESEMNYENEAESDKLPATPVSSVGSEEVVGSAPHLVASGSLSHSSLEAQGIRINTALDFAHMPILQVPKLTAGGHQAANFGGPLEPSNLLARSLSHVDMKPEASVQENLSNLASGEDSPSVDV